MNKFLNIDDAIKFTVSRVKVSNDIETFKNITKNISKNLNVIHIAGTNGKGSTVNFIKDILINAGYKVGTFTSPHLEKHQDRIRINDNYISDEKFLYYLNKNLDLIEYYNLSMFEIDVLIMCSYFKDEKVDFSIVEVGIGGRLDSTNIFDDTILSIITTISFDHMDKLGNTLKKIAEEKSYIIKGKSLIGYIDDSLKPIFENKSKIMYEVNNYTKLSSNKFLYKNKEYTLFNDVEYQMKNACCAIEAINILNLDIDYEIIQKSIKNSLWKGRFEKISSNPDIIIDGAHNEDGIKEFIKSMKNYKKPHNIVFSCLKDKNYDCMINLLNENCDKLTITQFDFYRAIKINEIEKINNINYEENYMKAIEKSISDGTLFICGSLYFISEIREKLYKK